MPCRTATPLSWPTANPLTMSDEFENVSPDQAVRALAEVPGAVAIDVRTPWEYDRLGHIPGAWLYPVQELPLRVTQLREAIAREGERLGVAPAVYVTCEHGVRSVRACSLLAAAEIDVASLNNVLGGMSRWTGPRDHGPASDGGRHDVPSPWLVRHMGLLPEGGRALDIACGRGRNLVPLLACGLDVSGVDRDRDALAEAQQRLAAWGARATLIEADLEADNGKAAAGVLTPGSFDVIVQFRYLHRPLFARIAEALAPGGWLIVETFTQRQAERGKPTNPDFLLRDGELVSTMRDLGLSVTADHESDTGAWLAGVVARKG